MSQSEEKPAETKEKESVQVTLSEHELEQLKADAAEYKHKYLHLLADSDNARKRLQKERHEIVQYSIRTTLLHFLHPIDNLENALRFTEQASDEVKHWALGFKMILTQFQDVLANNGVFPIESVGKEFDPHLHEAIEMVETTEYPPGTCIEENIRGYMIGDSVLRPSRVKVAKEPAPTESEETKS